MNAPRMSSRWLTASASAGSSRRVGRKSVDARLTALLGRLLDRALRGLGHHDRRGLRELQALRPLHARFDPAVDLVEELVDEDVRGDLLENAPVGVDEARLAPACDSEVCVSRLARAVDGASHDSYLECLGIC